MSEDKDGDKTRSWFPNLNNLLLILLAGTLLVSQTPFHQPRPDKPEMKAPPTSRLVDARPWQDPFEAVEKYIDEHKEDAKKDNGLARVRHEVKSKISNNDLEKLNIVAVMLPGTPYFEDSESRRKLRYAVLSGFDAALRYMPENPSHIKYFQIEAKNAQEIKHRVAYEWLVYKPVDDNQPPIDNERRYQRPPVLVLWLNDSDFDATPHDKLKLLIETVFSKKSVSIGAVNILGPFGSDNLQDLVNEVFDRTPQQIDDRFSYYSPSATLQDTNLLKKRCTQFSLDCELSPPEIDHAQFYQGNLFAFTKDKFIHSPRIMELLTPCAIADYIDQLIWEKPIGNFGGYFAHNSDFAAKEANCFGDNENNILTFNSLDELFRLHMESVLFRLTNLQRYFHNHGISFLRVTHTDQEVAAAIKSELKTRGIEPNTKHRILLLGEWDTLYGWHLPNTYAAELLKGVHNCKEPNEKRQDWDVIYDVKKQCIFRFSYLRGLDGEKKKNKKTNDVKSSNDNNEIGRGKGESKKLEEADGDSQYDYVRRLVTQIAELDGALREEGDPAHTIAAIGVLGSDVYDKLLILEALHDRFPDAVFFTNDMDARLLQPEFNPWARNLIVASGFGLTLDRHLQRDIPPLRDSIQTAYFLSTQLALAKSFKTEFIFDEHLKQFAGLSQIKLNELLNPPRIFELGRTRAFDLSDGPANCGENNPCIQPAPDNTTLKISWPDAAFWLTIIFSILLFPAAVRRFLQQPIGLWFIIVNLGFLYVLFNASKPQSSLGIPQNQFTIFVYLAIGFVYCGMMTCIATIEDQRTIRSWILPLNVAFIIFALLIPWLFVKPEGWLDIQEPYALLEGVSMLPTEGIRLLALILAGYFIIEVRRFPKRFSDWLVAHFQLRGFSEAQTSAEWRQTQLPIFRRQNHLLLNEWLDWKNANYRCVSPLFYAILFYLVGIVAFRFFGSTHAPFRGESMRLLDNLLVQGLLVPAFIFLLFLVIDVAMKAVDLVERCFPEEPGRELVTWPVNTLWKYANSFKIRDRNDMREWVGMRFIVELNRRIYAIIGYPLTIALLMILSRSSYFDNWVVSVALKLVIGSSLVILIYWDHRLNKAADNSRNNALKSLTEKTIRYNGGDQGKRLDRLITMIKNYDEDFYKSFSQRPIFRNSMLIGLALLADSVDYSLLASKLL